LDLNGAATGTNFATSFTEDGAPVALVDALNLKLTDVDSISLNGGSIIITNLKDFGSEFLNIDTTGTAITATYSAAGALGLSGWDTVANYEKVLRSVTYSNTSQNPDSTTRLISFSVNDSMANSELSSATVNVIPVNDAPTLTGQAATLALGTEDTAYTIVASQLLAGFTDADGDSISIANLTAANGTLSAYNTATGTWTFTPTANYNGLITLNYTVTDGHGGNTAATQSFNLTAVNDAPVLSVPGAQVVTSPALTLSGVNLSDLDAGNSPLQITLSAQNGVLSLASLAGISFTTGDGTQDSSMTFSGGLIAINNALSALVYSSNSEYYGSDTLTFTASDLGNTGSGGALTTSRTIDLSTAYRFFQGTNASETFQTQQCARLDFGKRW
jgi:hypothetical protein